MNKTEVLFKIVKADILNNEDVKREYDNLYARYQIISAIINARIELNITQQELANRVGTSKSSISRLESGNYNPSLEYLEKLARGLGKKLHIELK
jgi:DNA-binding XRE family transcriptional regulator